MSNPECSSRLTESVIITTEEEGLREISVLCGVQPGEHAGSADESASIAREHFESFAGCGWILDSEDLKSVDGIAETCPSKQLLPIPVFFAAQGSRMLVKELPIRKELLAQLSVGSPETLTSHGWEVKNGSQVTALVSDQPGFGTRDDAVMSHLNRAQFVFSKPEGITGLVMRRLYDAFHGRQRARILVNDAFQGIWFEPYENRVQRWKWGQLGFGVPFEAQEIKVTVDPAAGTPLWSVSRYEIWGLSDGD
jgi:hypothetical protein